MTTTHKCETLVIFIKDWTNDKKAHSRKEWFEEEIPALDGVDQMEEDKKGLSRLRHELITDGQFQIFELILMLIGDYHNVINPIELMVLFSNQIKFPKGDNGCH